MPLRPARSIGAALLFCVALGCGGEPAPARLFVLEAVRPTNASGVLLNEELAFTFSEAVDPTSVTSESLRIVSADGQPASGRWEVDGRDVTFRPEPVLAHDLSDGGYRPGMRYDVLVAGFPRVDGIRALEGGPLAHGGRWSFETAAAGEDEAVFSDESPQIGRPVLLGSVRDRQQAILPGDPIRLSCAEPLDPRTLRGEDFVIVDAVDASTQIGVQGSLSRNVPESSHGEHEASAVIELMPIVELSPGTYQLRPRGWEQGRRKYDVALADFGGNRVWSEDSIVFQVVSGTSNTERHDELLLSFTSEDITRRSPIIVPWSDGTASWGKDGAVRVRFPAAAGDGSDGRVEIAALEPSADLHAIHLRLPAGRTARLETTDGPSVLRAQGRLEIAGDLVRRTRGRKHAMTFEPHESLSSWLERARVTDRDWTVLIAGGDLVISGSVDVDTPLLLVAGGWIRIDGTVTSSSDVLRPIYLLGAGGGLQLDALTSPAPLVMDAPLSNPLREDMLFAAVSTPIPSGSRPMRWRRADCRGEPGDGSYRVRFLPPEGELEETDAQAVIHPQLLPGRGATRLLIELTVPAAPADGTQKAWNPPFVDFVDLSWE